MLTCTVGLLSEVGTWEGTRIRHPHIPRPWHPIRTSGFCGRTIICSQEVHEPAPLSSTDSQYWGCADCTFRDTVLIPGKPYGAIRGMNGRLSVVVHFFLSLA